MKEGVLDTNSHLDFSEDNHDPAMVGDRIAIVSDAWFPQINGVVRVLDTLKHHLTDRGYQVEIFAPDRFRTIPCPTYPEIPLAILPGRTLPGMLENFDPEVIHIATEGALGIAAKKWCLKNSIPFTTAYHTKFPEYVHARFGLPLSWLYGAMKKFHKESSSVLAPSPSVYRELVGKGFANVRAWSHGVDEQAFYSRGKDYLDLPRPIHMYVGRVAIEKNLEAFLKLDLEGSKVIVGSGPARDDLRKKYPDAHFFIAHGDDELSKYFSAADVFVFPSLTDTFGLTMIEALACGVPVAAFPVTGPLDVLGLDKAGETDVGCLDDDLVTAIERAKGKTSEACRAHALKHTWHQVTDEFLNWVQPFTSLRKRAGKTY